MSYRIEEKIPMTYFDSEQFIQSMISNGGKELFPKRQIKSAYFDNTEYGMFLDSEEGLLPRKKIRIREYPLAKKIDHFLEIKISAIEGRYKTTNKLQNANYQKIFQSGYFDEVYGMVEKKVSVMYFREYYVYSGIRITRDQEICYQDLNQKTNNYIEKDVVVELKAPDLTPLDFLIKIIPSRRRRFSKYCNAIQSLNLL
tara:strand:+ start:825 stop:1421 length:597 start_codon:yes stop_codon:yes gene_type:complete